MRDHRVEQSHDPALEDRWFSHTAFRHVSRQVSGLGGLSGTCRVFLGSFLPNRLLTPISGIRTSVVPTTPSRGGSGFSPDSLLSS